MLYWSIVFWYPVFNNIVLLSTIFFMKRPVKDRLEILQKSILFGEWMLLKRAFLLEAEV